MTSIYGEWQSKIITLFLANFVAYEKYKFIKKKPKMVSYIIPLLDLPYVQWGNSNST